MNQKLLRNKYAALTALLFSLFSGCRTENNIDKIRVPEFYKIVVVIGENEKAGTVFNNVTNAPYINSLAHRGAVFTSSFGIQHPSQPNYLCLFSGSNQGINDSNKPPVHFTTPNLGYE